jgi:hypothetical protein
MRAGRTWLLAVLVLIAGCAGDHDRRPTRAERPATTAAPNPPPQARCPEDLAGCRVASGRIAYVEAVDPDGDGDAHFVLLSAESVTSPGISVVDVRPDLRPAPLPGTGDRLSAAGPVRRGSFGQRQIEAIEVIAGGG